MQSMPDLNFDDLFPSLFVQLHSGSHHDKDSFLLQKKASLDTICKKFAKQLHHKVTMHFHFWFLNIILHSFADTLIWTLCFKMHVN